MNSKNNLTLVVLPGNSSKNREWMFAAQAAFRPIFKQVIMDEYDHWSNSKETIDLNIEAAKLSAIVDSVEQPVEIFAKSAGTILVLYAIHNKIIDPKKILKCVFVGFPLLWAKENGFDIDTWCEEYEILTTLIQNDHDPVTSSNEIEDAQSQGQFRTLELVIQKGDDHMYGNFDDFKKYF